MKSFVLHFSLTVLILLVGLLFGYKELENPYQISPEVYQVSEKFDGTLDRVFLESLRPAL